MGVRRVAKAKKHPGGRPPKKPDEKVRRVVVYLEPEDFDTLAKRARESGIEVAPRGRPVTDPDVTLVNTYAGIALKKLAENIRGGAKT